MIWLTAASSGSLASGWVLAAALLMALLVDHYLGEPPAWLHPVVWIGDYLNTVAPRASTASSMPFDARDIKTFTTGAILWSVGAAITLVVALSLQWALLQLPWVLSVLLLGLALKPMLAWAMLSREVLAVEDALTESLIAGRNKLSQLVSRDTSSLSESEVREGAIESLAENLNDSVVAPIFWFVVFGLPGAAVYRFANTADAMWGYRGMRNGVNWEWAGKWAAWADDALSWLPARITALLLVVISGDIRLKLLHMEARKTPSPNSGWPMAAMALALGLRLQKPGVYILNASGRSPESIDTIFAQNKASKVVLIALLAAQAAIIFIAFLKC